jgi:hypothetical protein
MEQDFKSIFVHPVILSELFFSLLLSSSVPSVTLWLVPLLPNFPCRAAGGPIKMAGDLPTTVK